MTGQSLGLLALYLVVALVCVKPLGLYMANVLEGRPIWPVRAAAGLERLIYRLCGIDPAAEMGWKHYAVALLVFNALGALLVYALQRLQYWLPLNPQHFTAVSPDSSFNTAVSFITNTNWQGYTPESTMSYLTQMAGLAVQNFLSAATGIVVAVALIRGLARHSAKAIGNFWTDVTRSTLYVLLPIAFVLALALVSQGVIQNFSAYKDVAMLAPVTFQQQKTDAAGNAVKDAGGNPVMENASTQTQTLPMGPIASQEAIKELGTNGGGFLNANSAHPYENPTPLANFLEMLAIILIPAALTYTFGHIVGDTRQGWAVLGAMTILFVALFALANHSEQLGNPRIAALGVDQTASLLQPGGNMEGKEARFGIADSTLFATITTGTSCGAVNSMHDSFTPLGGFVPLFNMMLGEVVFGGVGTGLYSMLIFAIIGVFIAGLMIGRTPEYLGKKIEAFEMKMASLVILLPASAVLLGTAIACVHPTGAGAVANPGVHGFSEILYALSSGSNNNGSCMCGITVNSPFFATL
ncbi:MAG: potassium-transporting ATPase subunit KdpA, partial [Gammaproteobacteria bacterium]|nr:potassium-transporting ATPase subunit KdpA [Gammaproteobacteria bacterium]